MLRKTRLHPCITFAWILSSLIARCAVAAPWCDNAFDLEPNTVWRDSARFEKQTFRWLLPSAGVATVDLLTSEPGPAWFDFQTNACGEPAAEILVIEQSPRHLVLAVRFAGHLYLRTDTEASPFRLITSFTETEVAEEAFDVGNPGVLAVQTSFLAANPADPVAPELGDPGPDGLNAGARQVAAGFLALERAPMQKAEPEVSDPDPDGLNAGAHQVIASFLSLERAPLQKAEPEVSDPDPDGLAASSLSTITPGFRHVLLFESVCHRTELDDHGDTPSCSTPLASGRSVSGELANDWRDDNDVFSFRLAKVSRVEIVLATEMSGFTYELSGPAGQRLAVDRLRANGGAGLHLVSTLAPGRYFFRVAGTSGAYALNMTAYD